MVKRVLSKYRVLSDDNTMKTSAENLENLIDLAHGFSGNHITIVESISRSRDIGEHDRHFATRSSFSFKVEHVLATFSGLQLLFMGADAQYGVSLDSVARFQANENELEIVEHFEQETERQTLVTAKQPKTSLHGTA